MRFALAISVSLFAAACHDSASAPPDLGPAPSVTAPTPDPGRAPSVTARPAPAGDPAAALINPRLLRRFPPLQPAPPTTAALTDLGRMLFYDKRLSQANDVSCNSCHALDAYGVDHQPTSTGHLRQRGSRNAPSVYHAAGQVAQFWDGRSPDVVDQAGKPIMNPSEMAMRDPEAVLAVLRAIPGYVQAFSAAFPGEPEPVTFAHLTAAIGAFEGGLLTPARWDRYLRGDHDALTADEVEGFRLFSDVGCVECHTGERLGGSMFQKAGRVRPWPTATDTGRYTVTHQDSDRMVFKVPSLRNIARTAPYFHDGSIATLEEAVRVMGAHQLDVELEPHEVTLITAWLQALTGDLPTSYIAAPILP